MLSHWISAHLEQTTELKAIAHGSNWDSDRCTILLQADGRDIITLHGSYSSLIELGELIVANVTAAHEQAELDAYKLMKREGENV